MKKIALLISSLTLAGLANATPINSGTGLSGSFSFTGSVISETSNSDSSEDGNGSWNIILDTDSTIDISFLVDDQFGNCCSFTDNFTLVIDSGEPDEFTTDFSGSIVDLFLGEGDHTLDVSYNGNEEGTGSFSFSAANSVPVPATLTLLGLGLAGIGYSRRKQPV